MTLVDLVLEPPGGWMTWLLIAMATLLTGIIAMAWVDRGIRIQLRELGFGALLGLLLSLCALTLALWVSAVVGSGSENAGQFLGVPIAHLAVGVLLVVAGTVAAVHAQRTGDSQRRRDTQEHFLTWVEKASDPELRGAAWRSLRQLVSTEDELIGPTRELAVRVLHQYLTSPCLEVACRITDRTCTDHPVGQAWLNDVLGALALTQRPARSGRRSPSKGVGVKAVVDLAGCPIRRSLDLEGGQGPAAVQNPWISLHMAGAVVKSGVTLTLASEHVSKALPEVETDSHLKVTHTGAWDSEIHVLGGGRVTFAIAGNGTALECSRVTVERASMLVLDMSGATDPSLRLSDVALAGELFLKAPSRGGDIELKDVKDGGGLLSLGREPFREAKLEVECGDPASGPTRPFPHCEGLDLRDSHLVLRGIHPPQVATKCLWETTGISMVRSSAEFTFLPAPGADLSVRFHGAKAEGDGRAPSRLTVGLDAPKPGAEGSDSNRAEVCVNYSTLAGVEVLVRNGGWATSRVLLTGDQAVDSTLSTEDCSLAGETVWSYWVGTGITFVGDPARWSNAPVQPEPESPGWERIPISSGSGAPGKNRVESEAG